MAAKITVQNTGDMWRLVITQNKKQTVEKAMGSYSDCFSFADKYLTEHPSALSEEEALLAYMKLKVGYAIEAGAIGFRGGWVSSVALSDLLEGEWPGNKQRDLLSMFGYIRHPSLPDGRANLASPVDRGKKPRLYVKLGHPSLSLKNGASVLREYIEAQGGS